jgi:hypothetical protein
MAGYTPVRPGSCSIGPWPGLARQQRWDCRQHAAARCHLYRRAVNRARWLAILSARSPVVSRVTRTGELDGLDS